MKMNPFKVWSAQMALGVEASRMMIAANRVVAERVFGRSNGDPMETWRMVSEKGPAFWKGAVAGMRAAGAGQDGTAVVRASIRPIRVKAEQNARRLTNQR